MIIEITLRGITGPSKKFEIDNDLKTDELFKKIYEEIGGESTGRRREDLRIWTTQKKIKEAQSSPRKES